MCMSDTAITAWGGIILLATQASISQHPSLAWSKQQRVFENATCQLAVASLGSSPAVGWQEQLAGC